MATKKKAQPELIKNENEGQPLTAKTGTGSFVFMDSVKDVLSIALGNRKNVILFGKGGYGKSEYTLEFLREQGIEPFVQTMGSGINTDRLFGGTDIKKFEESGKIEYLVENSFMNHEYVIFEELFDAPDFILEQLKDILSSKTFRNGGQVFPLKTKTIICCTNKTREEFSKNNSLKALMERFPLEYEVKWTDHNKLTYEKLLNQKFGHADPMLTYVLEEFAKGGHIISPRIAITTQELMATCGVGCLEFIADFNAQKALLKTSIQKFESIFQIDKLVNEMQEIVDKYNATDRDTDAGINAAAEFNKELSNKLSKLKAIKADDSLVAKTTSAQTKFDKIYNDNKKELSLLVEE